MSGITAASQGILKNVFIILGGFGITVGFIGMMLSWLFIFFNRSNAFKKSIRTILLSALLVLTSLAIMLLCFYV